MQTLPPPLTIGPDWWRGAVIYQIYPRSFFDSNGDGVGDLSGIRAKLGAIAALGVDALWISPFFKSPMEDFGYDVSNYCDVDPLFGTLDDFRALLAEAHALGLKILIDLVVSHTSARHAWFEESRKDRCNPKADWYVWADPTPTGNPPNNWMSLFGGGAWEWEPSRRQYYLHNFLKSQPDLNFHNPEVQNAVLDTARFWLDMGVDGFRLDVVNFYFHDALLRDNPPAPSDAVANTVQASNPYALQDHIYDKQRPENLVFLERFRALLDQYPGATTVGELGVDRDVARATEDYTLAGKRLHQVYSFELMTKDIDAAYIRKVVEEMERGVPTGWVSWAISNHDFARVISRWNYGDQPDMAAPMLLALVASLRGSPCLYQGEELGLTEANVAYEDIQDPYGRAFWPDFKGRDGCRTPYPWDRSAANAGFSDARPWLPVPPEHTARAYDVQDRDDGSALNRIRRFLHWRRGQRTLIEGTIAFDAGSDGLLSFRRAFEGKTLFCVFNLDRTARTFVAPPGFSLERASGFEAPSEGGVFTLPGASALFLKG